MKPTQFLRDEQGEGLLAYILLLAGVALASAAISMFVLGRFGPPQLRENSSSNLIVERIFAILATLCFVLRLKFRRRAVQSLKGMILRHCPKASGAPRDPANILIKRLEAELIRRGAVFAESGSRLGVYLEASFDGIWTINLTAGPIVIAVTVSEGLAGGHNADFDAYAHRNETQEQMVARFVKKAVEKICDSLAKRWQLRPHGLDVQ